MTVKVRTSKNRGQCTEKQNNTKFATECCSVLLVVNENIITLYLTHFLLVKILTSR